VALVGRTNAGKSTFLNAVLETKVSIVSNKPQTTRNQILGIKTTAQGQIVFLDTPGIHRPFFKLNEKMMKDVHRSLQECDLILYFVEIDDRRSDEFALSLFKHLHKKTFLIINKIDKYNKAQALKQIDFYKDKFSWSEIIPISALKKINLDRLQELIYKYLPTHELYYSAEDSTMQSEKFYLSELIREKILHFTRDELPFSTMVKISEINEKNNLFVVNAHILVETKSQKKIVIGKQGRLIKRIGELSRVELEDYFSKKVFLDLQVKVSPKWRNSPFHFHSDPFQP
jgi:GTP-binding protein Era